MRCARGHHKLSILAERICWRSQCADTHDQPEWLLFPHHWSDAHGLFRRLGGATKRRRGAAAVSGWMRLQAPPCERFSRSTPGALAPDRVLLSRSIFTYLAPSAPLAGTSRLHRLAAYTRCPRCAFHCLGDP